MTEQNNSFLSVKKLEVIYTSGKKIVHAVNDVSFDLKKGDVLALVGETGAGKTTIAKVSYIFCQILRQKCLVETLCWMV